MTVYLLDTDAYSQLKRGHRQLARIVRSATRIYFSTVVVGELLYGFRHGSRFDWNVEELEGFLRSPFVQLVPVSRTTSDRYSRVAARLRARGTPIPTNDIWVAAHAIETGSELLSFDDHYGRVDGLVWKRLNRQADS
ncbi:MAG: type II toxin-antitoxin system VapC family toxin [Acidobacteria bacterium]|nr:type II toxin-antitoxin system VapC family toxin [Acidobacteriota bacterium]